MTFKFKSETVAKHADLASSIKANLEVTPEKQIKEKESHGAYYSNLPEGMDKKTVEDLSKYNAKFVTAAHVAVGEVAGELFQKDKTLLEVPANVGFFGVRDAIEIDVSRSKTYENRLAKDDADRTVVKELVMKTTITTHSASGTGLKAVREAMSQEFRDSFKK